MKILIRIIQKFKKISLQKQIMILLAGMSLFTSTSIGWIAIQSATSIIRSDAMRAAGLEADSRRQKLRLLIQDLRQFARVTLDYLYSECSEKPECFKRILKQFLAVHQAQSAQLIYKDTPLELGDPQGIQAIYESNQLLLNDPNILAEFVRKDKNNRYFIIQAQIPEKRLRLIVQFRMNEVDKIFINRSHLGSLGESFLADSKGYFLTPPRFGSSYVNEQPINTIPMNRCLAGENTEVLDYDYRNTVIIHGFRYLNEIGGGCIMAHIDPTEAFAPARALRTKIIAISLLFLGLSMGCASLLSYFISKPIHHLLIELENAITARDNFLAIASHELKTPLTALTIQTELIFRLFQEKTPSPKKKDKLTLLLKASQEQLSHFSELITNLLDVSRISTGKLTLKKERLNLSQLIKKVIDKYSEEIKQSQCKLNCQLDETLEGNWDPVRLEQVIVNLLTNAIKYGARSPIQIILQRKNNTAILQVSDQGIGIAKENQEKVFDRFERAVSSKEFAGLGLGLFISRQIVEAHHGTIRVESNLGKGSTFIIELPLLSYSYES